MGAKSGQIRIGISGWIYPPWRGIFYPEGLAQKKELEFASGKFSSIEINGSFYSLQRPSSWKAWYSSTPPEFVFSVKGGRYITHIFRLREVKIPLANFFASGLLSLEEKLGPILWQLPPSLIYKPDELETFLNLLPTTSKAASRLAKEHDSKVSGHAVLKTNDDRPLRHAMEVRHPSFRCAEFVEQLRRHQVALVVADTAGKWPFMEDVTSDFIYARLHGDEELYVSGYTPSALAEWARKIRSWSHGKVPQGSALTAQRTPRSMKGRDVYVYFDNDVKIRAPYDAMDLAHRLKLRDKADIPEAIKKAESYEARRSWKV